MLRRPSWRLALAVLLAGCAKPPEAPTHALRNAPAACAVSSATARTLASVREPLVIRGYFSAHTAPELAPLIPRIRALLGAYRAAGAGKVDVELVDPTTDAARRAAKDQFGIEPRPLRVATRGAGTPGVILAYFAIDVQYGAEHVVLGLDDLIDVRDRGAGKVDVTLGNVEYRLTRAIRGAITQRSILDKVFVSTPGTIQLTAYITPATLPENWKDGAKDLAAAVDALQKRSGGKLALTTVVPAGDAQQRDLYARYQIRPYQDALSGKPYYFDLVLQVGDHVVRVVPAQDLSVNNLEASLLQGIRRAVPGSAPVVGVWQPAAPRFDLLRRSLARDHDVRDVSLADPVARDVAVLVLAGPTDLTADQAAHLDQFVMRGGALVVLDGHYRLAPGSSLVVEKVTTGIDAELHAWGIAVADEMVLDEQNASFPVPQDRDLGNGKVVRSIVELAYPYFVKLTGDELPADPLITSDLTTAVLHWASPVEVQARVGRETHQVTNLLRSSKASWLSSSINVEPDFKAFPDVGFPSGTAIPKDQRGARVLAAAVTGSFASAVPAHAGVHSPQDTRIVVFGSSAFASDDVVHVESALAPDVATANLQLVDNAVDWALADADLLAIPPHCGGAR